jgi:hypothetical protein
MKTLNLYLIGLMLFALVNHVNSQPTEQPIKIVNETNCPLIFAAICTNDGCESNFTSGVSGTVPAHGETTGCITLCSSSEFAALRFSFPIPGGSGAVYYITFSDQLNNECTGYEECNNLYPSFYQGTIEAGCMGSMGEVRADWFSEYDCCTIYFKYAN